MTNTLTLRSLDIPSIHKFAVGFDSLFDKLQRLSDTQARDNYPPVNIIKYTDDKYTIELAVAGFKKGDIEVTVENETLVVRGQRVNEALVVRGQRVTDVNAEAEYLHHGIGTRSFVRTWPLSEYVEVVTAELQDGILSINLERQIPEEKKPKTIQINYNK